MNNSPLGMLTDNNEQDKTWETVQENDSCLQTYFLFELDIFIEIRKKKAH